MKNLLYKLIAGSILAFVLVLGSSFVYAQSDNELTLKKTVTPSEFGATVTQSEFGAIESDASINELTLKKTVTPSEFGPTVTPSGPTVTPSGPTVTQSEFGATVTPSDFGAIEKDASTTAKLQEFFDYVRDNDVDGDFRGEWWVNEGIVISGVKKFFTAGTIDGRNDAGITQLVSIETTTSYFQGPFNVIGTLTPTWANQNINHGVTFVNSGSRNHIEYIQVRGFKGYGLKMLASGGSSILDSIGTIKIWDSGSAGSTYINGSNPMEVSGVVNSGNAGSVHQSSVVTVDAVDITLVAKELVEINGRVHIVEEVNGLDLTVYPWVDDNFTGTIYGLQGGLLVAGANSASTYIQQIDAIRTGPIRFGGLYGTRVGELQTQFCAIGLAIGYGRAGNNLGSRIEQVYFENNTFNYVKVTRADDTNLLTHTVTGNLDKFDFLDTRNASFENNSKGNYFGGTMFRGNHIYTRKDTEMAQNANNIVSSRIIGNDVQHNKVTMLDNTPIFVLTWDENVNNIFGKDDIDIVVFGTGTNNAPTNITFNLNSADETAGIRINDNGTPVTSKVFSGFSNAVKLKLIFDYANQEWNISYKGEAASTSVVDFQIINSDGGFLDISRDDFNTDNLDEIGGLEFKSTDGSFASGDEMLSRLVGVVTGGGLGVGSNSRLDLVYYARKLETQAYAEQIRLGHNGVLEAKQLKLSALNTAPSSASDTGTLGEIRIDSNYIYICIATDTWKRMAIETW